MKRDFRRTLALLLAFSLVGHVVLAQVGTYMSADEISSAVEVLEEQKAAEEEAIRLAEEEAARKAEEQALAEAEAKAKAEAEAKAKAEAEAKAQAEAQAKEAKEAEAQAKEAKAAEEAQAAEEAKADQAETNEDKPAEETTAQEPQEQTGETQEPAEQVQVVVVEEQLTEEAPAYVSQLFFENDDIKVTLEADREDLIPQDAGLSVTRILKQEITEDMDAETRAAIENKNARYDELCRSLMARAGAEYYSLQGLMLYDFTILQADGTILATQDDLTLTVTYKSPAFIADVDTTEMDVRALRPLPRENEQIVPALDYQQDKDDHNALKTLDLTQKHEIETVAYRCESLSPLALAWTTPLPDEVFTAQVGDVKVTVTARPGVIPQGAALQVIPIQKGTADYDTVEQQLNEKAAGEDYSVVGFLAYDIRFVDEAGSEVEPAGEVQVTMDYENAAAPEGVDAELVKDAEVTLMHLEENETGQVQEVVDLVADEATEASVETTEDNLVEKVDAVTESFSVYTITWNVKNGNSTNDKVDNGSYLVYTKAGNTYYALKNDGTAVELSEDVGIGMVSDTKFDYIISSTDYGKLQDAGVIWTKGTLRNGATGNGYGQDIDTYASGGNYISLNKKSGETASKAVNDFPQWIIYNSQNKRLARRDWVNGGWAEKEWLSFDTSTLTFSSSQSVPSSQIYLAKITYDNKKPNAIQTADTRSKGITINLFDYYAEGADNSNYTAPSTSNYAVKGINKNHSLKFTPSGREKDEWKGFGFNDKQKTQNTFKGEKVYEAQTGILKKTLENGYPVLESDSTSLDYLFNLTSDGNSKKVYADVNHLFQEDPDTGAFYYSSGINTSNLIRDQRMLKGTYAYYNSNTGGGDFIVYDGTYNTKDNRFPMGFFPFNNYDSSKTDQNGPDQYNHHFGMTVEAPFTMPHDKRMGAEDDRKNIQFGFSGDDDMWVFVDDVLVLDLGGIHEPVGGCIDFTTGWVWTQKTETGGTRQKLSDIFNAAGKTWDDSPGTKHVIKCYYMERGGQYSNLSLMISIPPEETAIPIEKIWQDAETNHDDYAVTAVVERRLEGTTDEDASYTLYDSTVLNKDNKWRDTFAGLPQFNDQGKQYFYRVRETKVEKNGQDITQNYERLYTTDATGKIWFINHKAGTPSISVEKIFTGLSWNEIQEIKDQNFTVTLNGTLDSGTTITPRTMKLDSTQPAPKTYVEDDSGEWEEYTAAEAAAWDADTKAKARNYKYLWVIEGLGTGTYTATETNAAYEPYTLDPQGLGTPVTVNEATWEVDATGMVYYTDCNHVDWTIGENKLFAITPKAKGSEKFCLVYTYEKLTSAQQLAVKIMTQDIDSTFLTGGSYKQFTYEFFYGDELNYPGKSYDGNSFIYINSNGELSFRAEDGKDAKSAWQHLCAGMYDWVGGKSAEITVKNIYSLLPNLDLEKVSTTNPTTPLTGAVFGAAVYDEDAQDYADLPDITVDADDDPELERLSAGVYRLKEKSAPLGCSMMTDEIYFKVSKKEPDDPNDHVYKIELVDEDGNLLSNSQTMYTLSGNETKGTDTTSLKLTIKNEILYSLPSTGGIGIYWTTLFGVLLMIAAGMLIIKKNTLKKVLIK